MMMIDLEAKIKGGSSKKLNELIGFSYLICQVLVALMLFLGRLEAQLSQLVGLDVKCDEEGMNVRIEFDAPFNGIIYSKGFYKDPNCR
jgi:hypothetical protein